MKIGKLYLLDCQRHKKHCSFIFRYLCTVKSILSIFVLFVSISIPALSFAPIYEYSEDHKQAYEMILSLRLEEGVELINKIKREQPNDILIHHIENYVDFLTIFINEDKSDFKKREQNKDRRLSKIKSGNKNSPYYLFSQAEIHLQWALSRIKFEEYLKAALEVNKAIKLLELNQKEFPEFVSNKKSLSILHAIAGTIPDQYKGIVRTLSKLDGTIKQGLEEIDEVILYASENDYIFEKEALVIKAMILLHLKNEKENAWTFLNSTNLNPSTNPLVCYVFASTALQTGRNDEAIILLEHRKRSLKYFPMYYLDLMLGSAKLQRLDHNANVYIVSYLNNFEGQNYIKDAHRKMAWYQLLINNDETNYKRQMQLCKVKGEKIVDEDKSALKEALSQQIPNLHMLKARVLYDGGYYDKALQSLEELKDGHFSAEERIEFFYRKGRILHAVGENGEALEAYQLCISKGASSHLYYACNAALQIGLIHEKLGDRDLAEKSFRHCLSLRPTEYRSGLHQKAKAGLKRIS